MRGAPDQQADLFDAQILQKLLPADHELKRIGAAIDWSFIDVETADLYSPDTGRPAYPAQVLFRMLFLEFYADLSDVESAEQCRYNLLFRSFVGLPLSGLTPDDTTLVVFRRRLGPERFRRLFDVLVEQCKGQDLLSGKLKIVDATHVLANVAIPNTVNLLREARKRLVTAIEADGGVPRPDLRQQYETDEYIRGVPTQDTLLASTRLSEELLVTTADCAGERVNQARALLEQVLCPTEGRVSSVVDPEARLGHKSAHKRFIGYKVHVAEDDSELVTTVQVMAGNEHEGSHLPEILAEEADKGIRHEDLVADALYDSETNRQAARKYGTRPHIPRRQHKLKADRFLYDPTSDSLRCPQGKVSTHCTHEGTRRRYSFTPTLCQGCPEAGECPPSNAGRVRVTLSEQRLYHLQGTPFNGRLVEYERKRIERKFGQAKTNHGLGRARYLGLAKMLIQSLLTFFVINAKRMVRPPAKPKPAVVCAPA
jgi:IS5 family transposase